ncbi:MAG: hypothetical protein JO001_14340 [Alphaproteobacteria bacterium]|nr:hypothetical protein [Alphaproteobacteria bacterium]
MSDFDGEYPTVSIKRAWSAARADGIKVLVIEHIDGERIAFRMTDDQLRYLSVEMARLSAVMPPPITPNT